MDQSANKQADSCLTLPDATRSSLGLGRAGHGIRNDSQGVLFPLYLDATIMLA